MLRLHGDLVSLSADDGCFHKLLDWIWDEAFLLYVKGTRGRLHPLPLRLPQIRRRRSERGHLCVPHGRTEADTEERNTSLELSTLRFDHFLVKMSAFFRNAALEAGGIQQEARLYRGLGSGELQRERSA